MKVPYTSITGNRGNNEEDTETGQGMGEDVSGVSHADDSMPSGSGLPGRVAEVMSTAGHAFVVEEQEGATSTVGAEVSVVSYNNSDELELYMYPNVLNLDLPLELMDFDTRLILNFFCGWKPTISGLWCHDIMGYTGEQLEADMISFDYLFPVKEEHNLLSASVEKVSSHASPVTSNTVEIFARNKALRNVYLQGVTKLLGHWQLRLTPQGWVEKIPDFDPSTTIWLKYQTPQNVLRMARMLQSLSGLGFVNTAQSLQALVIETAIEHNLPEEAIIHWRNAL